jgi:hypothetical protein
MDSGENISPLDGRYYNTIKPMLEFFFRKANYKE